jgi:hypothetical protein
MKTRKLVPYCLVVLLAGCGPILSLHPLFTKETAVFEEKLLGTWLVDVNTPESTWEFACLEADAVERLPAELGGQTQKCHRTNIVDKGRKGSFVACLVKLQDRLFLDIWPDKFPSGAQDPNSMKLAHNAPFFLPIHVFVRVNSIGDQVRIHLPEHDGLKKLLKAKPKAVKYDIFGEEPILAAPTEELQAFMAKYGDERLFPYDLTLKKESAGTTK